MEGTMKVLVVDDDRRMVKTICDILAVKGYETVAAYSGEEAVKKVNSEKPGCALMDLKMPGIDGIEALQMIKQAAADLPVVLMSAFASEEKMEEARRQGACGILTKPVDIQQVLSFLAILRKEESVLVVDDDPHFCRTLKDILQARGYRVDTEEDAGNVLGHMEESYKLAVILDIKLGGSDGLDVLRQIQEKYPSKPVVLVTGYREETLDSIEKGLRIGAHTCLYKPFEVEELVRVIREISLGKLCSFLSEPLPFREDLEYRR